MIDTDREAVERLLKSADALYHHLHHSNIADDVDRSTVGRVCETLRALLDAKEAAETERDALLSDGGDVLYRHLLSRAEAAEAERDALRSAIKEYLGASADSAGGAPDKWVAAQIAFNRLRVVVDWPTKASATLAQITKGTEDG